MEGHDFSRRSMYPIHEASETLFHSRRRGCFFFPCFDRSAEASGGEDASWWRKMGGNTLWERGIDALKKIREWSEILAGPRWKTFIRRFNRNRGGGKHANYQYDPLSYAMNFDEGCNLDGESLDGYFSRNFSSRYAKGTLDVPKPPPASS